ncbi:MAG TPA: hypothetical protein VE944_14725 [Nostoc sp.]|uniref:hypothetical protein n=1 Tax=Nostoc sp. TaxID=1180 RepID=UPI002D694FC3|nr:hypothetical protein [Nostoc sp.]HYX15592.1 hypothetical protein [Nostoc sp.]
MCSQILEGSSSDRIIYDTVNKRLFYKPKAYLVVEVAVNWQFLNSASPRRGQRETLSPCLRLQLSLISSLAQCTSVRPYLEHGTSSLKP